MIKNFVLLLISSICLISICACNGIKKEVSDAAEKLEKGYSEREVKETFESFRRKLPSRKSENLIINDVSYDNKLLTWYYIFEENGQIFDVQKVMEWVKDIRINESAEKNTIEVLSSIQINQRLVVKFKESGKVSEIYVSPQECEDAYRLK